MVAIVATPTALAIHITAWRPGCGGANVDESDDATIPEGVRVGSFTITSSGDTALDVTSKIGAKPVTIESGGA